MTRTPDQAKAYLEEHGISAADFARKHKIPQNTIRDVLSGRSKCKRGEAHRCAVLLGIKKKPRRRLQTPKL